MTEDVTAVDGSAEDTPSENQPSQGTDFSKLSQMANPQLAPVETGLPGLNLLNQWSNEVRNQAAMKAKSQVVQSAMKAYQSGDTKGAFALMGIYNPDSFQKSVTAQAEAYPVAYGKEAGLEAAKMPTGSTEGQLAKTKADAEIESHKMMANKGLVKKDDNSPTGFSLTTQNGVFPFDAYGAPATNPNKKTGTAVASASGDQAATQETLRPNEYIDPKTGQKALMSPKVQTAIKDGIKAFDDQSKDLKKQLVSLNETSALVDANISGLSDLDKIAMIKSLVAGSGSRINQQEIQSITGSKNSVSDRIKQYQSQLEAGKLTPEMQDYMRTAVKVMQKNASNEYNTVLHEHLGRLMESTKLPEDVLTKRILPSMPTTYQENLSKFQKNATPEEKQMEDLAFKRLVKNPHDKVALEVMRRVMGEGGF